MVPHESLMIEAFVGRESAGGHDYDLPPGHVVTDHLNDPVAGDVRVVLQSFVDGDGTRPDDVFVALGGGHFARESGLEVLLDGSVAHRRFEEVAVGWPAGLFSINKIEF